MMSLPVWLLAAGQRHADIQPARPANSFHRYLINPESIRQPPLWTKVCLPSQLYYYVKHPLILCLVVAVVYSSSVLLHPTTAGWSHNKVPDIITLLHYPLLGHLPGLHSPSVRSIEIDPAILSVTTAITKLFRNLNYGLQRPNKMNLMGTR